jgi:ankyrin repeat protein
MLLAWLCTAIAPVLVVPIILWGCHEYQRRHEAGRIVKAIETEDDTELLILLVEGTDFHSVREWFGEPALILAVQSALSDEGGFAEEAARLLVSHGANVNEPGTEWKTALMHAAANGKRDLCNVLLSYGADPAARDMVGWTAADWADYTGFHRVAYLLRKVEA